MAETLGMLCDKLTIVKLKQFHTKDDKQLRSLGEQEKQLKGEIDAYLEDAVSGKIPTEKLTFVSNKVYKKDGNEAPAAGPTIAAAFSQLADVNCRLWHEVEKGYDIENIPVSEKDKLIKSLAVLNLERNNCIDAIDLHFKELVTAKTNL